MKIYSQGQSTSNKYDNNLNYEQFSFNPGYLQVQPPLTGSQLSQNAKKFSFRSEIRKISEEKEKLCKNNSHIHVTSESQQKSRKKRTSKSPITRKKIFDESIRVTNLYERTSLDNKEQQEPLFISARQERNTSASKEEKSNAVADRIVQQPSHHDIIRTNPQIQNIVRSYPKLVEKVERNSLQITELNKKLQHKMAEDDRKSQYFMRLLADKERRNREIQQKTQQLRMEKLKRQERKEREKERIDLQLSQKKRLQQLILENKHLCTKVIEQEQRSSNKGTGKEQERIQERIKQLRRLREEQQRHKSSFLSGQSFNLDISMVPRHYIGEDSLQMPPTAQFRSFDHNHSLTSQQNPKPQPTTATRTRVPAQRDIGATAAVGPLGLSVSFSRIY